MSNQQTVTRRIEPGILEIDFDNSALIINYNMHVEVVDASGKVLKSKDEDKLKKLPLEVDSHTDVEELAEHIVQTQKYVPDTKLSRLVKLLTSLQEHNVNGGGSKKSKRSKKSSKRDKKRKGRSSKSKEKEKKDEKDAEAEGKDDKGEANGGAEKKRELKVSMDELDDYLDSLYNEDVKAKALGVRKILQLAKNDPTHLEDFIENEPLIGALSRVLQDDYKLSIELTLPLCTLFCIFSKFSDMHFVLLQKQIGSMAVKIVELELGRYLMRSKKMKEFRKAVENGKKDQAFLEAEEIKTNEWRKKQENLLCMCIRTLLNLSEDVDVERKMAQKTDLISDLVTLLGRRNPELLRMTMVFLKKLAIVMENSIKMTDCNIVEALFVYLPCKDLSIGYNALKLMYNLSFSPIVRKQVAATEDGIKRICAFLPNTKTRPIALKVLYNLSSDGLCAKLFHQSDCLVNVIKLCLMTKSADIPAPQGSLLVNLVLDPENAKKLCNSKAHAALMKKFFETHNLFLGKVVRVLALYTYRVQENLGEDDEYGEIEIWGPWIKDLFSLAMEVQQNRSSTDLLVEVLGIIANMTPDDLPEDMMWKDLLKMGRYQLLEFMEECCDHRLPTSRPDVIMQAVSCVGAFALEPDVCDFLAEHRPRIFRLIQLDLYHFKDDTGMILQVLFVLYRLLRFQEVEVEMLSSSSNSFSSADIQKFVRTVGEYVQHPHPEIQRIANALLDVVMEFDSVQGAGQLFSLARECKFAAQNEEWIEIVEEIQQNKRHVIEERGTVINDGEDDDSGHDSSDDGYVDANIDSGDYEYLDDGAISPANSDGLYRDEGKHGGGHGK